MTSSLTRRVAAAVNDKGRATAADLLPLFPGHTLRQVVFALHHAKDARLVSVVVPSRSLGYLKGWSQSVYGPYKAPAPALSRVSSVFDLGRLFAAQA